VGGDPQKLDDMKIWMALVVTAVGCHAAEEDKSILPSDAGLWDGAPYADYGKACKADPDCHGGTCFLFGDGTQLCTFPCTTPDQCPSGSQGQKCNKQGRCRP
jgi:hypothetical protein